MRTRFLIVALLTLTWVGGSVAVAETNGASKDVEVVLRAIDKLSAERTLLTVPVDTVVEFGDLEILVRRCISEQKNAVQVHTALLEIYETKRGYSPTLHFTGWMFSDSASLTSLEHPYYDVALTECRPRKEEDTTEEEAPAPAGE